MKVQIKAQVGKAKALNQHVAVVDLEVPVTAPTTHHTLLVLDCSTSMSGSIDEVRLDSQAYVAELDESDFVSVIIFSGHRTAKLIAGPTQCNTAGRKIISTAIQREVRLIGTTVFSEPLEMVLETVRRLSDKEMAHNAVLFTDGCAVPTNWSVAEEQRRALTVASKLRDFGAIVSVVGYGVYYDEKFLNLLMEKAGNAGVFRHISEIDDFAPAIQSIRDVFNRTLLVGVNLTFEVEGQAGRVFRTTPEVSVCGTAGKVIARGLYNGKATLYIELPSSCKKIRLKGVVGGVSVSEEVTAGKLSDSDEADFVRVVASYSAITGQREHAAELFALFDDDEGIAEKVGSAYTERESREAGDYVRRYFRDRNHIGAGLKATGPNHCVLNVLRALLEDEGSTVYIPKGAYKRSGELTADPRVIHPPTRNLKAVGFTSNEKRFNFSLTCLKDIKVLPESGKGAPADAKIWRTYNVVLDGNLHLPELEATVSDDTFKLLQEAGVIEAGEKFSPTKIYTVNLRGLKLISSNWANPATLGLVDLLREEAELKAEQKALNARRKELVGKPEEEDVVEGIYHEQAQKVEGLPTETYRAKCVELRLMGYKAKEYDCSKLVYAKADARVKAVRQRLRVVRYLIRAIIFAMETVGSKSIKWDSGKTTQRGEYPKLEQLSDYQGAELKKVTWEEECVCS